MRDPINVFIFRRDLRYEDNTAFNHLLMQSTRKILPIFIFNPTQIHKQNNPYYSGPAVEFMIECIRDVKGIQCMVGDDIHVLETILRKHIIDVVAFNNDHTPFAKARDERIQQWCVEKGIACHMSPDYVLFDYDDIKTDGGRHYEVYTPFYKKCIKHISKVHAPIEHRHQSVTARLLTFPGCIKPDTMAPHHATPARDIKGGRTNALMILDRIKSKEFKKYDKERDYPSLNKTTRLSPYLKFGCISIREAFFASKKAYGLNHGLVRELLWREFYAHLCWHVPRVLQGRPMRTKFDSLITWEQGPTQDEYFKKWCSGHTGFPFVDAGMRCLKTTGFLHNRLRMIVAMFLTKDLLVDWRLGERYFATQLVDYDPASNSGGWQWAASVGADAQPYYRIFNPWLQSEKFDKDAAFIKTYVPELKQIPAKSIHKWYQDHELFKNIGYPAPIVQHKEQTTKVLAYFTQKNQ